MQMGGIRKFSLLRVSTEMFPTKNIFRFNRLTRSKWKTKLNQNKESSSKTFAAIFKQFHPKETTKDQSSKISFTWGNICLTNRLHQIEAIREAS